MNHTATIIKVGAVVTATPRWVAALLMAEGFVLPPEWLTWWVPLSALLSAGMAITEAMAFAFIFEAWRNQSDRKSNTLLVFAGVAAIVFIGVVSPYIVTSVRGAPLADVLTGAWLWLWAASVAASTIVIVAAVGYAEKRPKVTVERVISPNVETVKSGKLPETSEKNDWRVLPSEDKQLVSGMSTSEIQKAYNVSERTARNWRNKSSELTIVSGNGKSHDRI